MRNDVPHLCVTKVSPGDSEVFESVAALAKRLNLHTGDRFKDAESSGFLIYSYSPTEIAQYVASGGLLLIARTAFEFLGYLLASSGKLFAPRHTTTQLFWLENPDLQSEKVEIANGNFCYLDQIGVLPDWNGKNVAAALLEALQNQNQFGDRILAAVLREPVHNVRSEAFFRKNGYVIIGEAQTPTIGGLDNVRSVLMMKPSMKVTP